MYVIEVKLYCSSSLILQIYIHSLWAACPTAMADPLRRNAREHPCNWSFIVIFRSDAFQSPSVDKHA